MSARDLVTLGRHIIDDFPQYYHYFSETEFTWNGITQPNRNPLLNLSLGVDGLKTGHTAEAGYGLVASAVQDGQRVLFMVGGLPSERARADETASIVKWAFGTFETVKFFPQGRDGRQRRRLARRGADGAARRAEGPPDAGAARRPRRGRGPGGLRWPDRGADRRRRQGRGAGRRRAGPAAGALRPRRRRRRAARRPAWCGCNAAAKLARDRAFGAIAGN